MHINRDNYEEYFISYIENELSNAERLAVERFANENVDLKNELKLFQQTKLVADEKIIFADKKSLLQKNSTKIIAWQWSLNTWATAAMLLLAVGLGWWMFSGKLKVESEKLEAKKDTIMNLQLPITNERKQQKLTAQLDEPKVLPKKKLMQKVFAVVKKEMSETIDTADLPNSWKSKKSWNETHEITVVQDIQTEEIIAQSQKKGEQMDTIKSIVQNSISIPPTKKQEEKIIAQIPFKTNKNERQILKMLAWASGKVLGKETNDGNFDVSISFAEISHKQALQDN